MSSCKNPDMEMDLCAACFDELKRDGRAVVPINSATDGKAKCSACGKKRYATRCRVSKEVVRRE